MKELSVESSRRTEFILITKAVIEAVRSLEIRDAVVTVFVPHTTAGVTLNENADPAVATDLEGALDRLVPWSSGYAHAEGNSAAHVKASLMGSSVRIPVLGGRVRMGTWQGIYFCEFDGPRRRTVWVF